MCRFKLKTVLVLDTLQSNFNTSYVSVQVPSPKTPPAPPGISIHLMCRFKKEVTKSFVGAIKFQYILCVGSSRA